MLDRVVDFWRSCENRCLSYEVTKSFSFQLRQTDQGIVVLRTKDAMSDEHWLPMGRTPDDVSFASPLLRAGSLVVPFHFVVPNGLPVKQLAGKVQQDTARLNRIRSARYPGEVAGDAKQWWDQFLKAETQRLNTTCHTAKKSGRSSAQSSFIKASW